MPGMAWVPPKSPHHIVQLYTVVHLKFGSDVSAFSWLRRKPGDSPPAFVRVRVLSARLTLRARFITAIKEIRTDITTELEVNHGIAYRSPIQILEKRGAIFLTICGVSLYLGASLYLSQWGELI